MKKFIVFLSAVIIVCSVPFAWGCARMPERSIYVIDGAFSDNKFTANLSVDFFNHSDNVIEELKFNLYGNAFRKGAKFSPIATQHNLKAYPNGQSYGDICIHSVHSKGGELQFEVTGEDKNVLLVELKEQVFPEERVCVQISYTLTLANVIARTGYNSDTVNLANFYPVLCALDENGFYECVYYSSGDPFYSDCADYTVSIECDSSYKVASSGKLVDERVNGKNTKSVFKIENARSVALVLSQKFQKLSLDCNGVQINYYYYDDQTPDKSIEYATNSIKLYENLFGKFPYQTYSVVQTKFIQGGMEFPSLVMISDDLKGLNYGEVIVHETAHQWWQTAVGNNEIEYGFLDEGLAEYSVILYYENYAEYGYTRQSLVKSSEDTFKVFCSVYDKLSSKVDTRMIRSLKDFSSEYEYVNVAYIKPCIMYDTLRQTIGENKFFSALKRYYATYKFKNATPFDLMGAFEKVGALSNGFFQTFFDGKEVI